MLRFIIKHKTKDQQNGLERESLETVDIHCEDLENILLDGGYSESGYDYHEMIGVEILD
jgi:hypothetical protein